MNSQQNRRIGSLINMINMIISLIIGMIYTPILIRNLGDSEYGIYTLAMSLIAYLSILDLGLGNALVRYTARVREQGNEEKDLIGMFLVFYLVISLVTAIIGAVLYNNIDWFFNTSFSIEEVKTLKMVFLIMLINTIISFPASVFSSVIRSHERFVFSNIINVSKNAFNHVLMIVLVLIGFKSIALAVLTLLSTIIVTIININFCVRKLKIKIGFGRFTSSFYKEVMVYSAFILINIVVDQLYSSTDKIILGKFCGSVSVAVYGVGVTFQQYYQQFSTSISSVYLPHISKMSVKEDATEKMSASFINVGHFQLVLLSLVAVGFSVYGRQFISLWTGDSYSDAYFIALLIMIPSLVPLSQNLGISILQAMNKHRVRSFMYLIIAIINVLLSIPLAIRFGGIGSAAGTAIGTILGQILFMNWYYWKIIGLDIPQYWRNFSAIVIRIIPVGLIFMATLMIPMHNWGGLALKIAIGMSIVAPYYYFVIFNQDERVMALSIIQKLNILRR